MLKHYSKLIILVCMMTSKYAFTQHRSSEINLIHTVKTKVAELSSKLLSHGFVTYKSGDLKMQRNTEFPIMVELKEGKWYQFIIVGDPEARKMEMKLGMEGIGEIVTDKFRPADTNEYWTQFSFICPHSGRYLLTFFQRGASEQMLAHVSIMQRNAVSDEGTVKFK